jgi:hypothetical protein
MGTSFDSSMAGFSEETGIIPRAARQLFDGIEARVTKARMDGGSDPVFEVYVNFIEVGLLASPFPNGTSSSE